MSSDFVTDQRCMMTAFGNTLDRENLEQASAYLLMMVEELEETLVAANPAAASDIGYHCTLLRQWATVGPGFNRVKMFDGAVDVTVVSLGFGMSMGFPMQAGWAEVLRSNMAKADPVTGSVIKVNGKVQKPAGWTPPDLAYLLDPTAS